MFSFTNNCFVEIPWLLVFSICSVMLDPSFAGYLYHRKHLEEYKEEYREEYQEVKHL